jgi:hypothetical protein
MIIEFLLRNIFLYNYYTKTISLLQLKYKIIKILNYLIIVIH